MNRIAPSPQIHATLSAREVEPLDGHTERFGKRKEAR